MAFRIPFNEFVTIEADTAADVRALVSEFGLELAGRRMLPAPAAATDSAFVGTIVEPPDNTKKADIGRTDGRTDGRSKARANEASGKTATQRGP